jgi:hypothetical protein
VPLTPDEVSDLERRSRSIEGIRRFVVTYGEGHADDWAGAWIDQDNGGRLVVQFARNIEEHRRAIFSRISPDANIEVREVERSLRELQRLAATLDDPIQKEWFATIPARLLGYGPDERSNRVYLRISTANPNAGPLIEAHFGWHGLVELDSDGTGAHLLPEGQLVVRVVNSRGAPVVGVTCEALPDLPGAFEHGTALPETDRRGECSLSLPATGYWIRAADGDDQLGMTRAVVTAGKQARVTLMVHR